LNAPSSAARRITHVVAGLGPQDGGPAYSVPRLCDALGRLGADVSLLSVAYEPRDTGDVPSGTYRHRRYAWDHANTPILREIRASSDLARALRVEAARSGIVHNHGVWLMPNVYAGKEARRAGIPLVVAPRGMLAEAALAFSSLKKRLFWAALQRDAFRDAACFHATSEQEYREVRAYGLGAPVAVIPNGIDIPQLTARALAKAQPTRTVLSLGRIHPKKGLDQLLRAWKSVEAEHPDWRLRIVGPGEGGHDEELKALAESLGLRRASVEPPVYGSAKEELLQRADLFVLPTLNENFALTVAEALASAVPVISTKGAPWGSLEREGCGWWIDHGVESLAAALRTGLAEPPDSLQRMGAKGRAWMLRDFSWDRVAGDMRQLYAWLSGAAECPAFVRRG
jgi:glycosyltransferase involved in cell wall biosynthesis